MTSLEELVLWGNDHLSRDDRLDDTLSKLTSLKKLDMRFCRISKLPEGWVHDLLLLESVQMLFVIQILWHAVFDENDVENWLETGQIKQKTAHKISLKFLPR